MDAIWSITLDGFISGWNKSSEKFFGYRQGEILGKSTKTLMREEEHKILPELLGKIKKGEAILHYETIRVRKDGSLINVSLSMSPIKDISNNLIGAAVIARDITIRIEAEKKEKELRTNLLLEKMKNKKGLYNLEEIQVFLNLTLNLR